MKVYIGAGKYLEKESVRTELTLHHAKHDQKSHGKGGGDGRKKQTSSKVQAWAEKKFKNPEHAKAFVEWFGDSKVVDKNGEPLVAYHGTRAEFEEFDIGKFNKKTEIQGAWFGTDRKIAEAWGQGVRVVEAHIKLSKPATFKDVAALAKSGVKTPKLRAALIKQGYDGIYDPDRGLVVAFEAKQIKSATGNRGTFDPKDPRIDNHTPGGQGHDQKKHGRGVGMKVYLGAGKYLEKASIRFEGGRLTLQHAKHDQKSHGKGGGGADLKEGDKLPDGGLVRVVVRRIEMNTYYVDYPDKKSAEAFQKSTEESKAFDNRKLKDVAEPRVPFSGKGFTVFVSTRQRIVTKKARKGTQKRFEEDMTKGERDLVDKYVNEPSSMSAKQRKDLHAVVEKAPKKARTLYRGLAFESQEEVAGFVAALEKKGGFTTTELRSSSLLSGFAQGFASGEMSTGKMQEGWIEKGVMLKIKGKTGANISKISPMDEGEVLIPKGVKYKHVKTGFNSNGVVQVEVKEV